MKPKVSERAITGYMQPSKGEAAYGHGHAVGKHHGAQDGVRQIIQRGDHALQRTGKSPDIDMQCVTRLRKAQQRQPGTRKRRLDKIPG